MDYRQRWELKDYLIGQRLDRRIHLLHAVILLVLAAYVVDFWYLQGVRGAEYARLAENNRLRRMPLLPARGVVFDRHGAVLAATRPSLDLVLLGEEGLDVEPQLERLAPILGESAAELAQRIGRDKGRPRFEPFVLREDVGLAELARIEARREQFPSLEVRQTVRRSYPYGDMFAHVMGYVGEASEAQLAAGAGVLQLGDLVGKSGIERTYDDRLRGQRGWNLVSVNNVGRHVGESRVGSVPAAGQPIDLTLDLELQRALREGLGDEVGAGVFMDPWTGEILALVSTPAFDPNSFVEGLSAQAWSALNADPDRPLHDRAIASYYAPGSTFKVLMAIAGLESGAVTPNDAVFCRGSATIYGHERLCWRRGGHGTMNLRSALTHSCNVYFYHLGERLKIDTIHDWGERFGLGHPTGVDLPGEARGVLPSDEWKRSNMGEPWYPGDTISVAIGQGLLTVTPLQLATMVSTVATAGRRPTPHLIRGAGRESESVTLHPGTLEVVRQAMRDAVHEGTGRAADLEGARVAGKTGTAQVYKRSAGIDADLLPKDERDHAWFAGFAPVDAPRIAFAVVVEHGGHGGTTACPIVRHVLEIFFSERDETPRNNGDDRAEGAPRAPTPVG
jgi:penicillin-binding protein 2